tara:strand:- start:328 stop:510 length:183 start_codon:yes stop_codon:yes gene_type:complete
MKTLRLKDLNRGQLTKLVKTNQPHLQVRKNMTLKNLRLKLNVLGGDFAFIKFDKNWVIKN